MRITTAHIENLTDWINHEKGYPLICWVRDKSNGDRLTAQIGHIHAYRQSGHWSVVQVVTKGGGERDLRHGTAREVYEFLRGMQEAIILDKMTERYMEKVA